MIAGRVLRVIYLTAIGFGLTPMAFAAGDQAQPLTTEKVIRDTKEAVEFTKQYTMQHKERFQKTVQAELAEMQAKIAELQKKTSAASVEARKDMQKALQDLERKKDEARKQLDEVSQFDKFGLEPVERQRECGRGRSQEKL
ncbi:MAG: hypothetical protein QM771_12120 [Nitrospira sp.]